MVYSCSTCPGRLEEVCQDCIDNCHKYHNKNSKNIGKRVLLSEVVCQCALNNHMVKETSDKKIDDVRTDTTEVSCDLNATLSLSNSKYYYNYNKDNCYYCLFCIKFCKGKMGENIKENFTLREVGKFSTPPKCHCNKRECHSSFEDNIRCTAVLLLEDEFDKFYNKSILPFQMIKNKETRIKLFTPLLETYKNITDKIYANDYSYYQLNQISKDCLSSAVILMNIASSYEREKYQMDPAIEDLYSFHFLKLLFKTEERRNDFLVDIKISSLQLFRNLYLTPNISFNNLKYIENFMLVSPFHRILLTLDISVFFKMIKIKKEAFLDFVDVIGNSIINYAYKIEDDKYGNLIMEYLEYISLLLSYRIKDKKIVFKFIDKIQKILVTVSSKIFY